MHVQFIGQPFGGATIGSALADALQDDRATEVRIAVAWGKASGLTRIGRSLADFRDRRSSNRVEIVLGIDEGGATWEGLELARAVSTEAFVYHDAGVRTFHPKIYSVLGPDTSTIIIGSGNTTRGGLFGNYEAAVRIDLDPDDDDTVREDVVRYLDSLLAQQGACKVLDESLIKQLRRGGYRIVSEADANRRRKEQREVACGGATQPSVFSSIRGLATAPPPQMEPIKGDDYDEDEATGSEAGDTAAPAATAADVPAARFGGPSQRQGFYKRLSEHDVSLDQSPGQIVIPKRFEEFFPPLSLQWDQLSKGGSRQSEIRFPAHFRDGDFEKALPDVRVIRYEPKPSHKRKNTELRFTFRDREVLKRFKAGDFIRFTTSVDDRCIIDRVPADGGVDGRFDWL